MPPCTETPPDEKDTTAQVLHAQRGDLVEDRVLDEHRRLHALRLSAGGTASANRDPRIFALFLLFKRLIEIRIYGFSITFRYIISWFWIFRLELDLLWIKSIQIDLIHNKSISNR